MFHTQFCNWMAHSTFFGVHRSFFVHLTHPVTTNHNCTKPNRRAFNNPLSHNGCTKALRRKRYVPHKEGPPKEVIFSTDYNPTVFSFQTRTWCWPTILKMSKMSSLSTTLVSSRLRVHPYPDLVVGRSRIRSPLRRPSRTTKEGLSLMTLFLK